MSERRSAADLGSSTEALLAAFPFPERDWESDARAIEARFAEAGPTDALLLAAPLPAEPGEPNGTPATATPLTNSGVRTQSLAELARRSVEKKQAEAARDGSRELGHRCEKASAECAERRPCRRQPCGRDPCTRQPCGRERCAPSTAARDSRRLCAERMAEAHARRVAIGARRCRIALAATTGRARAADEQHAAHGDQRGQADHD